MRSPSMSGPWLPAYADGPAPRPPKKYAELCEIGVYGEPGGMFVEQRQCDFG
jgi:hypothetical protein